MNLVTSDEARRCSIRSCDRDRDNSSECLPFDGVYPDLIEVANLHQGRAGIMQVVHGFFVFLGM